MPRGYSIHIGVDGRPKYLNPNFYINLLHCEDDIKLMQKIAQANELGNNKFIEIAVLSTTNANAKKSILKDILLNARPNIRAYDTLLITYSGHGYHKIKADELGSDAWCLNDEYEPLLIDELTQWLLGFHDGVRVHIVADTCRSEEVNVMQELIKLARMKYYERLSKLMPIDNEYADEVLKGPSIIFWAACCAGGKAKELGSNGLFTSKVYDIWELGKERPELNSNYSDFLELVKRLMSGQEPERISPRGFPNVAFEGSRPFRFA